MVEGVWLSTIFILGPGQKFVALVRPGRMACVAGGVDVGFIWFPHAVEWQTRRRDLTSVERDEFVTRLCGRFCLFWNTRRCKKILDPGQS